MDSTTLAKIPVVTSLTKSNSIWTYNVTNVNVINYQGTVNLRLPVGLYVVLVSDRDPSDSFAKFIKGMHKYRFSLIEENDYINGLTTDSNNNVMVSSGARTPLEEYLYNLTKITTDVNSIDLCTDDFGKYFNLPFITYINGITNGLTYKPISYPTHLQFFDTPSN